MIEKVDFIDGLKEYGGKDLFSVRIMSLASAYGCKYPFARFYRQLDDNDTPTAVISVLDRDMTVSHIDGFDSDELVGFANAIGYSTLLCSSDFEICGEYTGGAVMKSSKKLEIECDYTEIDEYPHLFDLFNFIDYGENDFESWYVDISHRIRHNCAKAVSLNVNDEIVSSAVFSSIYEKDAVLSAVRTKREFQGLGYGSALVSAMCCSVKGDVYLMRELNKNEAFYNRLGFENCGNWRIYK